MPVLTDDQFVRRYFEYVIQIHLAQQREFKRLRNENTSRIRARTELRDLVEITRKIKICDDKFADLTKEHIQVENNIVSAIPIIFSRLALINAFLDRLKTVSEIFGRNQWRQGSYNYTEVRRFFLTNLSMKDVIESALDTIEEISTTLSEDVGHTDNQQIYDLHKNFIGVGDHDELLSCIENQINCQNINYVQNRGVHFDWKYWKIQSQDNESKEDEMTMDNHSPAKIPDYENLKHWERRLITPIFIFQIVVLYYKRARKFCIDNKMKDYGDELPGVYYLAFKPQR